MTNLVRVLLVALLGPIVAFVVRTRRGATRQLAVIGHLRDFELAIVLALDFLVRTVASPRDNEHWVYLRLLTHSSCYGVANVFLMLQPRFILLYVFIYFKPNKLHQSFKHLVSLLYSIKILLLLFTDCSLIVAHLQLFFL